jgi:hypothetical protein
MITTADPTQIWTGDGRRFHLSPGDLKREHPDRPTVDQLPASLTKLERECAAPDTREWQLDDLEAERRVLLAEVQRRQRST